MWIDHYRFLRYKGEHPSMRFKGLDLNLLVALDVLLQERNVSRAAERLNISQSALSGALARLRQHFGDEILVPSGRQLVPTALSASAAATDAILQIEAVVSTDGKFNPQHHVGTSLKYRITDSRVIAQGDSTSQ
jgi:hypothetical protein